jgi:hypothetical protein
MTFSSKTPWYVRMIYQPNVTTTQLIIMIGSDDWNLTAEVMEINQSMSSTVQGKGD